MKPTTQSALVDELLSQWLADQPVQQFFLKLLDLCDGESIYVVDKNQKVLHWSDGAEKLTGFNHEEIVGRICSPECVITDVNESIE